MLVLWLALLSVRGGCASVSSLLSTDPLVASVLRTTVSSSTLSELESSAAGLALWRRCLSAGSATASRPRPQPQALATSTAYVYVYIIAYLHL